MAAGHRHPPNRRQCGGEARAAEAVVVMAMPKPDHVKIDVLQRHLGQHQMSEQQRQESHVQGPGAKVHEIGSRDRRGAADDELLHLDRRVGR